jgi:hypothetical protein
MRAIFLIMTVVLIGAPFLILSVNASQFNVTCPNNHGGMINDTGGFSCLIVSHFDPWYMKGFEAGMMAHGNPCPFVSDNLTLQAVYCQGWADGDAVGN